MIEQAFNELRGQIDSLRADQDLKHRQNREDAGELRDQIAAFIDKVDGGIGDIRTSQERNALLLVQVVGENGQPGEGRLGEAEKSIDKLRQFTWKLIGGGMVLGFVIEHFLAWGKQ